MVVSLLLRDRLDVNVLHERNPLFVTLADGSIRNTYALKLLNMEPEPRTFLVRLQDLPGAEMWHAGAEEERGTAFEVSVEPDRVRELRVFVTAPAGFHGTTDFVFRVTDEAEGETARAGAQFHGPQP
jgi:polyferredoxin